MNLTSTYHAGAIFLVAALVAGCGDKPETSMAPGAENSTSVATNAQSQDNSMDARAIIDRATAEVEARKPVVEAIKPEDVIPAEYRAGGELADSGALLALAIVEPVAGVELSGAIAFIQAPAEAADDQPDSLSDTVFRDSNVGNRSVESVRIIGKFSGLQPGPHGFHIHEIGDCSAPEKGSAGEHYNPGEAAHGGPDSDERHVGDLGNLSADAFGNAFLDVSDPWLTLEGVNTVVGKAIVVHADRDDLSTPPAGNAGAPIACGVIENFLPGSKDVSRVDF